MDFYLVRHGEAKSEQGDPARPLSEQGRRDVEAVAKKASGLGVKVSEILCSGKLRARQTAEILVEHLSPSNGLSEINGLKPFDNPQIAQKILDQSQESLMLVGHLPHLSRLVSLLLTGYSEKDIVHFEAGAMLCLSRVNDAENGWILKWFFSPTFV